MDKKQVLSRLREEIDKAGSQREYAKQIKASAPYINDIVMGRREPGPKILKVLGLKKVVSYEERKQ